MNRGKESTDDAFVEGHIMQVSPRLRALSCASWSRTTRKSGRGIFSWNWIRATARPSIIRPGRILTPRKPNSSRRRPNSLPPKRPTRRRGRTLTKAGPTRKTPPRNSPAPGQLVDIKLDAYPSLKARGRVDSMAVTGSRFSLLPAENATGNDLCARHTGRLPRTASGKNNNASALINLARNLGGSIGIAISTTLIARRSQFHQSRLVENISSFDTETHSALDHLQRVFSGHASGRARRVSSAQKGRAAAFRDFLRRAASSRAAC